MQAAGDENTDTVLQLFALLMEYAAGRKQKTGDMGTGRIK